jgi:hypothetical protein
MEHTTAPAPTRMCHLRLPFTLLMLFPWKKKRRGRQSLVPFSPVVYSKQKIALQRTMKLDLALSSAATTQDQHKASPTTPRRAQVERLKLAIVHQSAAHGISLAASTNFLNSLRTALSVRVGAPQCFCYARCLFDVDFTS